MRKIELPTIELNGEEFPFYCDLYVLDKIQEKMDLNDFERSVIGAKIIRDKNGDPEYDENKRIKLVFDKYDIDTLVFGMTLMINEGLTIEADQDGKEYEPVTEKYIGRICDLPLVEMSKTVHEAFGRCCSSKKNKPKTTKSRK